jgi:PPOX class probable F420-dependent enzyme
VRLNHVRARPQVALHFDGDTRGGDIVVLAGTARPDADAPPSNENADYVAKYGDAMIRVTGSHAAFNEQYPVALRIDIRRIRGH